MVTAGWIMGIIGSVVIGIVVLIVLLAVGAGSS